MKSFSHFTRLAAFSLLLNGLNSLSAQTDTWAKSGGGAGVDFAQAVTTDDQGNAYVAGYFTDTLQLGWNVLEPRGGADIFLAKYSPAGTVLWAKSLGWGSNEFVHDIEWDGADGLFLGGEFQDSTILGDDTLFTYFPGGNFDAIVVKFDTSGNYQWNRKTKGSGSDFLYGLDVDDNGGVVIAGKYRSNLFFGEGPVFDTLFQFTQPGKEDIFLARYDQLGNFTWAKRAGGLFFDGASDVAIIQDSVIAITGFFQDTCYFGPNNQDTLMNSFTGEDVFVAKFGGNGNYQWVRRLGSNGGDVSTGILLDANRNIYVSGNFDSTLVAGGSSLTSWGGKDAFLARYSSNGNLDWIRQFGGEGFDGVEGIALSPNGKILTVGFFQDTASIGTFTLSALSNQDQDMFVAAWDNLGNVSWVNRGKGENTMEGLAIGADPNNYVFAVGDFLGDCQFGQQTLVSAGAQDFFVLRLNPAGAVSLDPQNSDFRASVFPNPFDNQISILMDNAAGETQFSLFSVDGKCIHQSQVEFMAPGVSHSIAISNLPAGIYFLRIHSSLGEITQKLIKF